MKLLSKAELKSLNNAQPCTTKYGDVFQVIAKNQFDQDRQDVLDWLEYNAPEYVWQRFKDGKDIRVSSQND